jgi:hypothetical protein
VASGLQPGSNLLSFIRDFSTGNLHKPNTTIDCPESVANLGNRWCGGLAFGYDARMSEESDSQASEKRAWQYFLQLQPSIADVNAAAELAFRAVDAFDRVRKRRQAQDT